MPIAYKFPIRAPVRRTSSRRSGVDYKSRIITLEYNLSIPRRELILLTCPLSQIPARRSRTKRAKTIGKESASRTPRTHCISGLDLLQAHVP